MNDLPTLVEIPVREIGPGPKVRAERVDLDHVARLRLHMDDLPPITVRQGRNGWELVDGQHRLSAHKFEERATIRCQVVELDDVQAFAAAVKANTSHGLYLSLIERKHAARWLVERSDWSDARIAAECGIDRKTVAGLRPPKPPIQPGKTDRLDAKRESADGKKRPADEAARKAQRAEIARLLTEQPDLSLSTVAERVGCAPMTVASVRDELKRKSSTGDPSAPPVAGRAGAVEGEANGVTPPAPARLHAVEPQPDSEPTVGEVVVSWPNPGDWKKAEGMDGSTAARDFALVMDRRLPRENEPTSIAAGCPAAARPGAVAAAQEAAQWWTDLAAHLANPTPMEVVK